MSIEISISIAGMPISVETSKPQTPVLSQAGEPLVEGPLALPVAARAVQEADQRQPPSNVDLRPQGREPLLETFRVKAHVIQTVHAPVTLLVAARVGAHLVAVAEPVAHRAAAAHVVVVVAAAGMAVEVMAAAVMAAAVENKYVMQ